MSLGSTVSYFCVDVNLFLRVFHVSYIPSAFGIYVFLVYVLKSIILNTE